MNLRILRSAETGAAGVSAPEPTTPTPAPPAPTPKDAVPPAAAPPAAHTVINGDETEDTAALKRKLAETEAANKKLQTEHAELEDQNRRLKQKPDGGGRKSESEIYHFRSWRRRD